MNGGVWSLDALMVHEGPMRLIDEVLEADDTGMVAVRRIRDDELFLVDGAVGGWVGIEFMAQTVGAWAGWRARQQGKPPKTGYLLGTRRYRSQRSEFRVGELLRMEIRERFQADNGLGQFDCTIRIGDAEVAAAALTVFQPRDDASPAHEVQGDD